MDGVGERNDRKACNQEVSFIINKGRGPNHANWMKHRNDSGRIQFNI